MTYIGIITKIQKYAKAQILTKYAKSEIISRKWDIILKKLVKEKSLYAQPLRAILPEVKFIILAEYIK